MLHYNEYIHSNECLILIPAISKKEKNVMKINGSRRNVKNVNDIH